MAKREMQLELTFRSHGGKRTGAGRKPASKRPPVHHVKRPKVPKGSPAHVTVRVCSGVPSLRNRGFISDFQATLRRGCERGEFRVCHLSIQRDHVHLLVEAAGKEALGRGMKSVGIRLARAVNRVFRRKGPVLFGRYHLRVLRTPREVRHALAYVLLNARKHWRQRNGIAPPAVLDIASSGAWFDGWKRSPPAREAPPPRPVAPARSFLLRKGWRRYGLVDPAEMPGRAWPDNFAELGRQLSPALRRRRKAGDAGAVGLRGKDFRSFFLPSEHDNRPLESSAAMGRR